MCSLGAANGMPDLFGPLPSIVLSQPLQEGSKYASRRVVPSESDCAIRMAYSRDAGSWTGIGTRFFGKTGMMSVGDLAKDTHG